MYDSDMQILMADDSHNPISQVQTHDLVQSENPDTKGRVVKEVLSTSVHIVQTVLVAIRTKTWQFLVNED